MTKTMRRMGIALAAGLVLGLSGTGLAASLEGPVTIYYDAYKVPTIQATSEHDAIFMQGYLHAKNRLFQMDFQRRLFSGRVSELVGSSGLSQDVQLRTLGLKRAAERSLLVQSPEGMAWLQAYADGVNAFLSDTSQPLPIEYGALEINRAGIDAWTPLDSLIMAKGLAFGLSFDLVEWSTGGEQVCRQVNATVSGIRKIARFLCGLESAPQEGAARGQGLCPVRDMDCENQVDAGSEPIKATLLNQIQAKLAEAEPCLVVAEVCPEHTTQPCIRKGRSVAVAILQAEARHPADNEAEKIQIGEQGGRC